jgi:long-chain acyl-CoA synthetase
MVFRRLRGQFPSQTTVCRLTHRESPRDTLTLPVRNVAGSRNSSCEEVSVREFTVPATITVPDNATTSDAVFDNARSHPELVSLRRRVDGGWQDVTASQFAAEVTAVAKGLVAAGIEVGERVALMSKTRYEWTLLDYAIWTVGAVTVPIYETSSAEQVQWIINDSGAVAAVVETAEHEAVLDTIRADLPDLTQIWRIDADAIGTLTGFGRGVEDEEIERRRESASADDLATIIYTSGTTGRPKGCELTHRNLLFDMMTAADGLRQLFTETGSTLLFLPLAHVFGRVVQCGAVMHRARLSHTADVRNLLADLKAVQPTFVLSVPRVFEKVYNASKQRAHADGKGRIFDAADRTAVAYSQALDTGRVPLGLRLRHALFDRLVYGKLRDALGGQMHAAISGGAPLGPRLGHFFRGIGVTVYEGYGLTETTAGACVNLEGAQKIGTVGRPLPGVSVRVNDDGELLLKGQVVFRGYWRNDTATADALTDDGWFHTGDIGEIDTDGFVRITGRKKELIVTAAGKNVAPAVLEDRLRAHPLISHCMVVGDQQAFVGCLVTIDPEAFPAWKQAHGKPADATIADLRDDPLLRAAVQEAIDDANKAVSRAESIRKFRILPRDFTEESGELTPTMKLKRTVVLKQHADEVAAIYA